MRYAFIPSTNEVVEYSREDLYDVSYETFDMTVPTNSGYILIHEYTTYDSFSESNERQYEVFDAYSTYEIAKERAEELVDMVRNNSDRKLELCNGHKAYLSNIACWGVRTQAVRLVHFKKIGKAKKMVFYDGY
jgi:hypothetical protein